MRTHLAFLVAVTVIWLVGFVVLGRTRDWTFFAVAGPALMALLLSIDGVTRLLMRPTFRNVAIGVAAGLLMLLATQLGFIAASELIPAVVPKTAQLYDLLNVSGFSVPIRAGMIVVVATSEEVIFRGAIAGAPSGTQRLGSSHWLRGLALALIYGITPLTLGNELLVLCAMGCGMVWGAVRLWSRSLVAPILTHVVWDLGVLIVWPLI